MAMDFVATLGGVTRGARPEQNFMFVDHYLDVEYDSLNLLCGHGQRLHTNPRAFAGRMEVLRSTATPSRKRPNRKQFLVKKQLAQTGLTEKNVQFTENASDIIRGYTRESGVRNLEREIGNICRKIARKVVKESGYKVKFTAANVPTSSGHQVPRPPWTREERSRS